MSSSGAKDSPDPGKGTFDALSPSATGVPQDLPKDGTATYDSVRSNPVSTVSQNDGPAPEMSFSGAALSVWSVSDGLPDPHAVVDHAKPPDAQPAYKLIKILGRGGMGEVWEGEQVALARRVAVKRVRRDAAHDGGLPVAEQQFRQEALIAAQIEHPNVVPVHDLGVDDHGNLLLAMKLVHGRPWDKVLADDFSAMPEAELLAKHLPILRATAQAVTFAHDRGVIHRDIKPSQVMVGEFGEVVLMDWGLALLADRKIAKPNIATALPLPTRQTASSPSGTPALMAPEQTRPTADDVGPWTDVYLLGGTLYFLLTGSYPHSAPSAQQSFLRARVGDIDPPSVRAPERRHAADLVALCLRALEPAPTNRPKSALEFLSALDDHLTGSTRRREAQTIVTEVTERLDAGALDYEGLAALGGRLDQAWRLYGDHPKLPALRDRLSADYARTALGVGDLAIASVHAHRIGDDAVRSKLEAGIAAANDARARTVAQRRWLLIAALLLLGLVAIGTVVMQQQERRTIEAESQRLLAQREVEQERDRNDLISDMFALVAEETELAARLANRFPPPLMIDPSARGGETNVVGDSGAAAELLARRQVLSERRAKLLPRVPRNSLPPAPTALVDAEAYWLLHTGTSETEYKRAKELLEKSIADAPENVETVATLGIALAFLGDHPGATARLREAVEMEKNTANPRPRVIAAYSLALAEIFAKREEVHMDSREFALSALEVYEPESARMLVEVGRARLAIGPYERGLRGSQLAIELLDAHAGQTEVRHVLRGQVAMFTGYLGLWGEAAAMYEQIHIDEERSGRVNPLDTLRTRYNISVMHRKAGNISRATDIAERLVLEAKEYADIDPKEWHQFRTNYALCLKFSGRHEEAEQIYREELDHPESPQWFTTAQYAHGLLGWGQSLSDLGRYDEALEKVIAGSEILTETFGPDNHDSFTSKLILANIYSVSRRLPEAIAVYRELFSQLGEPPQTYPEYFTGMNNYATALGNSGLTQESLEIFERIINEVEQGRADGTTESNVDISAMCNWIMLVARINPEDETELRDILNKLIERTEGFDSTPEENFRNYRVQGMAREMLEEIDLAADAFAKALSYKEGLPVRLAYEFPNVYNSLGRCLSDLDRFEEAREAYRQAVEARRENQPDDRAGINLLAANLGRTYLSEAHAALEDGATTETIRALAGRGADYLQPFLGPLETEPSGYLIETLAHARVVQGRAQEVEPLLRELSRRGRRGDDLKTTLTNYAPELLPALMDEPTTPSASTP